MKESGQGIEREVAQELALSWPSPESSSPSLHHICLPTTLPCPCWLGQDISLSMWKEPTQLWLTCVCRGPRGYTHTDLPESPGLPPRVLMHVSHMYPSLGGSPPCLLPCDGEPHLPIPCLCMRAHTPASDSKQPPEHLLSGHSPLHSFLHPRYQAAHRLVSAR